MNEWMNIYIARLKAYKCMLKKKKNGPARSPWDQSSIYGEIYGGKDSRKRCVLSLEWKREGVIEVDRGGDESVDLTCEG